MANKDFYAASVGDSLHLQPTKKVVNAAMRELIDRLLLERISHCCIARAVQVSETWPQQYVNEKYSEVARTVTVTKKRGG